LRYNAFGWRHRTSLNLIVSYLPSIGHLVASSGLAIRVNRDWLPHLRPKTGGGCTIGLRLGFNDLSLFRIRHYSAHHSRNYAYCYSLFRQVLNHVKLALRFKRSQMIRPAETPAAKRSVESTERIWLFRPHSVWNETRPQTLFKGVTNCLLESRHSRPSTTSRSSNLRIEN
jgi:hypothetical protein